MCLGLAAGYREPNNNMRKRIERILIENFNSQYYILTLTYNPKCSPESVEDARRQMQNYIRKLKRYCEKHGLTKIKYIAFIDECKNKRLYHQIIISSDIETAELKNAWNKGIVHIRQLSYDGEKTKELARYLADTPLVRSLCVSQGLNHIRRV